MKNPSVIFAFTGILRKWLKQSKDKLRPLSFFFSAQKKYFFIMNKICTAVAVVLLFALSAAGQAGIGTTTPNSMLDVRGSLSVNYRAFTTAITALSTDNTLAFEGTVARVLTLPTAVGCTGRFYWVKNASTTLPTPALTVVTTGGQTIDGNTNWLLDEPNEVIRLVSDGSNWYVLNQDVIVPKTATTGGAWSEGGNRVTADKSIGTISTFNLPFITNNVERMRLTTTGYLGLGTTLPAGRLHLVNETVETGNDYIFDDYGAGTSQGIYMTKSRGTVAAPADLQNGDAVGFLRFVPRFNGSVALTSGSSIDAYYKGISSTNDSTDMRLFTSGVERMRLSEAGYTGIGVTAFTAANPEKLLVDAGTTTSFNVISGKGSINNYLQ
ncbi:MAG TPA: hypothetical protein VKI61_11535, partial [Chitinophagaceae bacterium]|nr:hypothetical protein [Chitinophagaceae bacterium]